MSVLTCRVETWDSWPETKLAMDIFFILNIASEFELFFIVLVSLLYLFKCLNIVSIEVS